MTPFAQLDSRAVLEKSGFLKGLGTLMRQGIWRTAGKAYADSPTGWRKGLGTVSKAFYNPTTDKSTKLAKGLMGYGFAGMASPLMGVDLPGSNLAFNTTMPGIGALFAAPSLITSARMARQGNQDRLKGDVMQGAQAAAGDLLTSTNMDPRVAWQPGYYQKFMEGQGVDMSGARGYLEGSHKPMGGWHALGSMFENPQALIDNKMDMKIQELLRGGMLGKSGGLRKQAMLKAIGGGLGKAMTYGFPVLGVGLTGHALLKDKPYDAQAAQQRGYAGAQAAIQQKLQGLSGMERFALRMDPSLLARQLEEKFPGTIGAWEKGTGNKYQPGWISKTIDTWQKGGNPSYYTYDAAGQRHYLENS